MPTTELTEIGVIILNVLRAAEGRPLRRSEIAGQMSDGKTRMSENDIERLEQLVSLGLVVKEEFKRGTVGKEYLYRAAQLD